jgi:hypothetical protein
MKTALAGLFCLLTIWSLPAQDVPLTLLGNKVAVYESPDGDSPVLITLNWDSKVTGSPVNEEWFILTDSQGLKGYVYAWDAINTTEAEESISQGLTPKRITPSASTLFRLMRYYKKQNNIARAQDFSIRIINTHNDEEFPTKDKACFKLGHLAYMEMISDPEKGVIYDSFLMEYTRQVLEASENETIQAMAHYHQARYQALNGEIDAALSNLLYIVEKYPTAFSRNECEPEVVDSWYYKPERAKRLFCALGILQPQQSMEPYRQHLKTLAESDKETVAAVATELLNNIGDMPYERDNSIWY